MRRIANIIVLSIVVVILFVTIVFAADYAKSGYWERVITSKNTGASTVVTRKTYWKGNQKRTELYTINGVIVEIKDGQTIYTYMLSGKQAEKVVVPAKYSVSVQNELAMNAALPKGAKQAGTASVKGIKCNIYKITAPGRGNLTLYISTDPKFPLPLKSETVIGKASEVTETKSLKLNYNVPDSMFKLPAGLKVTERKVKEMPDTQSPSGKK